MVGSATASDRFATPRRDERVSYILRAPETQHRFGISSLALSKDRLFTAGRDGTVRSWIVPAVSSYRSVSAIRANGTGDVTEAKHSQTFDEHVDWVNDVVLIEEYDRLVSCSSDTTLKVWNAAESRKSLRTLVEHTDYVKALTLVPNGVASGSLDGRVLVWDLVTGNVKTECGAEAEEGQPRNSSVYCMTGSIDGNTLVTGSTDRTISVWDVRTGDRIVRLRGHSDSVRCLTMKYDGHVMLSGGSDSTVRLWDLRHERCTRSFDSYAEGSVWALESNYDFDLFVSGGRDGTVWHTDINSNIASLIVPTADPDTRSNMVLDVSLTPCNSAVWVSTTGSTVRLWPLAVGDAAKMTDIVDGSVNTTDKDTSSVPEPIAQKQTLSINKAPLCVIQGLPGIIAHRILNDRRHVLTCDTLGEYKIWNITTATTIKSLGSIADSDIDEIARKYDHEVSVPSWFQVDIRLGSLSVRLERSSVANAEIYGVDAGLDANSEDIKVNIGEHVVRALFRKWMEEYKRRVASGEEDPNIRSRSPPTPSQKSAAIRAAELPQYTMPDHIPVIVTEDHAPVPILRRRVDSFDGTEQDSMPSWVVDLLRDGKGQTKEQVKLSFNVAPWEDSGLPELSTSTLNAPRVLRVKKVAMYIAKELKDSSTVIQDGDDLEILCNGQSLAPSMSLATVKQFKWKSPGELSLQFRLRKTVTNH